MFSNLIYDINKYFVEKLTWIEYVIPRYFINKIEKYY